MSNIGIIAEFNPFHNGHKYLIEKSKRITKADNVVAICSGNYVQRGEPAIFDKYIRTKQALSSGVDALFELPYFYSTSSAETFARSAVKFLIDLNCIDYLCFGCEYDNIKALPLIAGILCDEPEEYKNELSIQLNKGLSFPKARELALGKYCSDHTLLNDNEISLIMRGSNNILAIEYLKALKYFKSTIRPVAIKRAGADYLSLDLSTDYSSATAIRSEILKGNSISEHIPETSIQHVSTAKPITFNDFELLLGDRLLKINNQNTFYDIPGDLFNRISNNVSNYTDLDSLKDSLHSKNYTDSTINRSLIKILLNADDNLVKSLINNGYHSFARLLGINRKSNITSELHYNSKIPIIDRFVKFYKDSDGLTKQVLDCMINADNLYNLVYMTKYKQIIPNEFEHPMITNI